MKYDRQQKYLKLEKLLSKHLKCNNLKRHWSLYKIR